MTDYNTSNCKANPPVSILKEPLKTPPKKTPAANTTLTVARMDNLKNSDSYSSLLCFFLFSFLFLSKILVDIMVYFFLKRPLLLSAL